MKKLRFISGIAVACSLTLLAACGQKGPLYLPVKPAPSVTSPTQAQTAAPAPVEGKKTGE